MLTLTPAAVERIGVIAVILSSSMLIPQLWRLYSSQNADGLSLTTYVIIACASVLWILYHIGHKTYLGVISGSVNALVSTIIVIGILTFTKRVEAH